MEAISISQSVVDDDRLREYVQEAESCLSVGAFRAAVVLGWSATVYHLYRMVETNGLDLFRRSCSKKNRGGYEIKPDDDLDRIRLKVHDSDLLEICYRDLGLLSSEEHYRLNIFRDWRNKSAHPSNQSPAQGDTHWLFVHILGPFLTRSPDIEYFSVQSIKSFIDPEMDDPLELHDHEAELLIERVHPDNYMPLMGELLKAYLSPDHYLVHGNVVKLRKFLAERLPGPEKRKQTNRQLARLLAFPAKRSDQPIREVIFWPDLQHNSIQDRQTIIRHFIVEFAELINVGQYALGDVDILTSALRYAEAQDQGRIVGDFLIAFEDCYKTRQFVDDDRVILQTLINFAKDQNFEKCTQLLLICLKIDHPLKAGGTT